MKTRIALVALAGWTVLAAPVARAAGSEEPQDQLVMYGMAAAINGSAQVGSLEAPVDVSASDLFSNLQFGAMASYRHDAGVWSYSGDATFMAIGTKATSQGGRARVNADLDQTTVMLTLGREMNPHLDLLFSLAYFDLAADLKLSVLDASTKASKGADWIDPSVGLRYSTPISDKWRFIARGDVGGFGIGSDLLLHGFLLFQRQQTETFGWFVGYRVISFDYEEGSGRNYQRYDLTEHGPGLGVTFAF